MSILVKFMVATLLNAQAGTFLPYSPLTKTAFALGEGDTEEAAKRDARSGVAHGYQASLVFSSPILDCASKSRPRCRYYLPLEPASFAERADYVAMIERRELQTWFVGYGRSMEDAERDLLLKTGKQSLTVFLGNVTHSCPKDYRGSGAERCANRNDLGNFTAETGLPRLCFLKE